MAWVIVAVALGVITINGGLFLRRLLGELAEVRRQITGIERQVRAQRAHVKALRQLLAEEGEEDSEGDGGPPPQAAVVNGHEPGPQPGAVAEPHPPDRPEPVRRKKHLGLYL
ncbi:hypothetical protein ACTWQJ_12570, partial [Streptomyces sp. KR55]